MALLSSPTPSEIVKAVNTVMGKIESLSAADIRIHAIDGLNASNVQEALAASFQSVTSGKSSVEDAIIEKGGTVSKAGTVATFDELVQGVSGISTSGSPSGGGEIEVKFENQVFYGESRSLGDILSYSYGIYGCNGAVINDELIMGGGWYYANRSDTSPKLSSGVYAINPASSTCRSAGTLSKARSSPSIAIDDEVIFGGGADGTTTASALATVDAVNPSTKTRRNLPSLSKISRTPASTGIKDEVIFGGGQYNNSKLSFVNAINPAASTIRSLPDLSVARSSVGCGSVEENIVFGGGDVTSGNTLNYNVIDVINSVSETITSFTFSLGHQGPSTVSFDSEVIFAGSDTRTAEAVNPVTRTIRSLPDISTSEGGITPRRVENEILFVGGYDSTSKSYTDNVDAINPVSNTKRNISPISQARSYMASGVIGGEVVCAGGYYQTYPNSKLVDVINPNPGSITFRELTINKSIPLSTDISIDVPCTYRNASHAANERFAFDSTVTLAKLGDVTADSVTVKGTYYIKQGEYSL